MHENREIFESMPVPKALMTLAIPTIISQLITMIYNLADTFYIGRTNDPYKVAAATIAFTLMFLTNALANLFGMGGGSLISRLLGRQEGDEARKVCSYSFYCTLLVAAVYCICVFFFMDPLLRLMGASDFTLDYTKSYAFWVVVVGGVPTTLSVTMAHLLRSEGYAKKASLGLGMGGVLNILLDPLFMFVIVRPGNEVTGAAVATMLSNVTVCIYFLITFYRLRGKTVLALSPLLVPSAVCYTGKILAVGVPSALNTLLACASNITMNKLASNYNDVTLAAVGVVKKIDMLPLNTSMGLCQGMVPLVAYNYSAKNYDRMRAVTRCARIWGMAFAVLCIVCFESFAGNLVSLFIDDAETVRLGTYFLRICCLATPLMLSNVQMNFMFQAMGQGKQALLLSACRQGLVNIPLLFLMDYLFQIDGVVWTQLLADSITMGISFALYFRFMRSLKREEQQAAIPAKG